MKYMKKKFVDSILPFQVDSKNLRGRFACVEKVTSDTLKNHHFPDEVCALLIEALLLTILTGEMIKIRWRLSLQIRGSGSIKLLATDYYAPREGGKPARVRAYADYDKARNILIWSWAYSPLLSIKERKWSHIRVSLRLLKVA